MNSLIAEEGVFVDAIAELGWEFQKRRVLFFLSCDSRHNVEFLCKTD